MMEEKWKQKCKVPDDQTLVIEPLIEQTIIAEMPSGKFKMSGDQAVILKTQPEQTPLKERNTSGDQAVILGKQPEQVPLKKEPIASPIITNSSSEGSKTSDTTKLPVSDEPIITDASTESDVSVKVWAFLKNFAIYSMFSENC
jgi:hypothetical protein